MDNFHEKEKKSQEILEEARKLAAIISNLISLSNEAGEGLKRLAAHEVHVSLRCESLEITVSLHLPPEEITALTTWESEGGRTTTPIPQVPEPTPSGILILTGQDHKWLRAQKISLDEKQP